MDNNSRVRGRGRGRSWSRSTCVFEEAEVVDHVTAHQRAAPKRPPVHHSDAERWVEVLILRQLLNNNNNNNNKRTYTSSYDIPLSLYIYSISDYLYN